MLTDRQGQLVAVQQQGLPPRTPLIKVDPGRWPLLLKLVDEAVLVHVSPYRNPGLCRNLPSTIRDHFDERHVVMRGFNLGGRNSLVLVGDQHGMPFSDRQLELLEKTARVIERGMRVFSRLAPPRFDADCPPAG